MNGKQFAGSTYIEHAKYYEEQYQKHHQKQHQVSGIVNNHLPHYEPVQWAPNQHSNSMSSGSGTGSVTFRKETNETPLTESELDYFFWKTLVHLGWRKSQMNSLSHKSYQLMLTCVECDLAVVSQQSHTVTLSKAKKMSDKIYVVNELKMHKKKCKPLEYDENGDLIEAIPEATPFESFTVGDTRFDTIDGYLKVFNGSGWVAVGASIDNTITAPAMPITFNISPEAEHLLAKNMITYLDNK